MPNNFTLTCSFDENNDVTFAWSPHSISVPESTTPASFTVTLVGPATAQFFGTILWNDTSSGTPIPLPPSMSTPVGQATLISFTDTNTNPGPTAQAFGFRVVVQHTNPVSGQTFSYLSPDPVIINEPGLN